jgi:hypothetical protein
MPNAAITIRRGSSRGPNARRPAPRRRPPPPRIPRPATCPPHPGPAPAGDTHLGDELLGRLVATAVIDVSMKHGIQGDVCLSHEPSKIGMAFCRVLVLKGSANSIMATFVGGVCSHAERARSDGDTEGRARAATAEGTAEHGT